MTKDMGTTDEAKTKAMLRAVRKAQSAMLLVVAVQVLGVVYLSVTEELSTPMMGIMLAIAAVYVGLWAWCKRNPLEASIVGLVVFVVIHAIEALLDPAALARGVVVIVGITAVLVWAVVGGMQHRKLARAQ
jgi:FtsH-binding integral membrane protein